MDFNDTPEEARFPKKPPLACRQCANDDAFRALSPLEQAKIWQKKIRCRLGPYWLGAEFGGRGASAIEEVIWGQEESKYDLLQPSS